ncbi:MAG: hypothetical protein EOP27_00785 [Rhodococcus sp. (in: high G+C Gram-positive bacteria)]|nr:MAG: hypothetical protein EOP27_00785 [Rhodococcus sp. (in: high G+C Gram-positive bacteria)]
MDAATALSHVLTGLLTEPAMTASLIGLPSSASDYGRTGALRSPCKTPGPWTRSTLRARSGAYIRVGGRRYATIRVIYLVK